MCQGIRRKSKNQRAGLALAVAVILAPLAMQLDARAAEPKAKAPPPAPPAAEQQVPTNEKEMRAVEKARTEIAKKMYVSADSLPVLSIEARTWPNSGLGCVTADTATILLPVSGYAVVLATPVGPRRVHVAGWRARICDPNMQQAAIDSGAPVSPPAVPSDLSAMVQAARADLARRLDAPLSSVRLVSFTSVKWPDSTMECPVPYEQTKRKPINGYRVQLWQGERMYTYHTDFVRTRACPSIESPRATFNASRPLP